MTAWVKEEGGVGMGRADTGVRPMERARGRTPTRDPHGQLVLKRV